MVGLPLSLSGEVGPAARAALEEAAALRALLEPLGVAVETADERFTTVEAERSLRGGGAHGQGGPQGGRQRGGHGAPAGLAGPARERSTGPDDGDDGCRGRSREPRGRRRSSDDAGRRRSSRSSRRADRAGRAEDEPEDTAGAPGGAVGPRCAAAAGSWPLVGGCACSCVVLAFVLWYELESHALGPPGPQVVVTVHRGRVDRLGHQRAERSKGVIGSSLAFQISDVFHGTPTVLPGQLRPAPEPDLLRGAGAPGRRAQHLPGRRAPRLHALRGGRRRSTAFPATPRAASRRRRRAAPCTRTFSPPGLRTTSRACSAPGST